MKRPLTRKETAPRNVAAKALRQGQFQPKVEPKPDAYHRRPKHQRSPLETAPSDDATDAD